MKYSGFVRNGIVSVSLAAMGLSLTSCEDPNAGKGAVWGGMAGAAIGAIAGDDSEAIAYGAAAGAAMGAVAGGVMKAKKYKGYGGQPYPGPGYQQPPTQNYPVARWSRQGFVVSPYSGREVDVRGFRSGEIAIDPTVQGQQLFIVP